MSETITSAGTAASNADPNCEFLLEAAECGEIYLKCTRMQLELDALKIDHAQLQAECRELCYRKGFEKLQFNEMMFDNSTPPACDIPYTATRNDRESRIFTKVAH